MSILYLHGFASGPRSRKAQFFSDKLAGLGFSLEIPDLAEGDFEHLTISRQLQLVESLVDGRPSILIGSSLGGYITALYAARHPNVRKVILLAPAFGFYQLWLAHLGPEQLAAWERDGALSVFHHGEDREVPLSYQFFRDAARHEPFPDMQQPALLFHGDQDSVVPVEQSLAFVRTHEQARLVRLPSGHELTDVLESIWGAAKPFLLEETT